MTPTFRPTPIAAATLLVLLVLAAPAEAQLRPTAVPPSVAAVPNEPFPRGGDQVATGQPVRDRWIAMDKAKHLGGSTLLTLSAQYVLVAKADWSGTDAVPLSAGAAAAVGLGKELYDRYAGPTRYFSRKDLAADALGILLGVGVILL